MIVAQRARDENIRNLAISMMDMLAFVEEVDALKRIRLLEIVVSDMLREINACAVFIQEYIRNGSYGESNHTSYSYILTQIMSN
jgi:hypothetical protein